MDAVTDKLPKRPRDPNQLAQSIVALATGEAEDKKPLASVAKPLSNRVQLTSDGHKPYLEAAEGAFGGDIDYAMLVKIYGTSPESTKGRYSPRRMHWREENACRGKPR